MEVEPQPPATAVAPVGTLDWGVPMGEGGEDVGAAEQPASSMAIEMRTKLRFT